MIGMVRAELHKLARRPMSWIALGIVLIIYIAIRLLLLLVVLLPTTQNAGGLDIQETIKQSTMPPQGLIDGINFLSGFGIFALIVVAASMTGNEFGWGTIGLLASRGTPRWQIAGTKLLSLGLLTLLWLLVMLLTAALLSSLSAAAYHQPVLGNWLTVRAALTIMLSLGRAFLGLLPYVAAAVAIGLLSRSSAATMGCVLGYVFVEQLALPIINGLTPGTHGMLHHLLVFLQRGLVGANASVMSTLNEQAFRSAMAQANGTVALDLHPYRAALILVGYTAFFCALAMLALRNRDLAPRASVG